MLIFVFWAIIKALDRCELDVIDKLDIRAFINLVCVAARMVRNVKTKGSTFLERQRFVVESIDHKAALSHFGQRYAGVKIVVGAVKPEEPRGCLDLHRSKEAFQTDGVALLRWVNSAHVLDLKFARDRSQILEGEIPRLRNFTAYS